MVDRTFVCCVLCLDIAEYSRHNIAEQIQLKEWLVSALSGSLSDDTVVRDSGGGVVVTFLADPEHALWSGSRVRNAFQARRTSVECEPGIRGGISLGPARLVKDLNGMPSIVGDAVTAAQRITTVAEPGQLLVSRTYKDVMLRLSQEYAKLFSSQGVKVDGDRIYAVDADALDLLPKPGPMSARPDKPKSGWATALAARVRSLFR